jgi:hypothetical protein
LCHIAVIFLIIINEITQKQNIYQDLNKKFLRKGKKEKGKRKAEGRTPTLGWVGVFLFV